VREQADQSSSIAKPDLGSQATSIATRHDRRPIRWLRDNQLVDEMNLLIVPVVVGEGIRLFPDIGPDLALELVDSRAIPKGATLRVYRPTGRPFRQ
jgi:RibD C-terminal domain